MISAELASEKRKGKELAGLDDGLKRREWG